MLMGGQQALHNSVSAVWLAVVTCFLSPSASALEPPARFTVFAASSLTNVLEEAISAYHDETLPGLVTLSVAGTGTLARQIEAGAPVDVFISADREWIDYLSEKGLIEARTATHIATNRLVLVTRDDLRLSGTLDERLVQLAETGRIAMGDPAAVPAGRYAREALQSLRIWSKLEGAVVPTDNVRVALALVLRGEVEGAIIYATDAVLAPGLTVQAVFFQGLHEPINYWAVAVGDAPWTAFDFIASLRSNKAAAIWIANGFLTP
jgi:molybdate transport system substrate-binding protein